jgi:serine protease AprX
MKKIASIALNVVIILSLTFAVGASSLPGGQNAGEKCQSFIVTSSNSDLAARVVSESHGQISSVLTLIDAVTACIDTNQLKAIKQNGLVKSVFPNAATTVVGNESWDEEGGQSSNSPSTDYPDAIGADLVWQDGINGTGVTVAVLDTGISRHRGLMKGIEGKKKTRIVGWVDFVANKKMPTDPNGHGTHIAGIIANSQLGADGEWNGVAPGVNLVGVRVLNANGKGTYETVIKGIQWVLNNKEKYNIKVMNLSLVAQVQSPYWADPLNQAIMRAWSEGLLVVVAAGNTGSAAMTVGVPGNNPYVITVGAFTDNFTPTDWSDDYVAPFSAAGPTLDGFVKPDVLAPGAHMVSTMLPSSTIAKKHQANKISNQYFSMAGTSQSAAVVSGVSALILSNNADLTPDEVKYRVMYTAFPWTDPTSGDALYSVWQQGAGRVNAYDAVYAPIDGSANAGMDILADIDGTSHFEGYSYWDEDAQAFRLLGDDNSSTGAFGLWSGGFGLWSGAFGLWSGGFGLWSGGFGLWSGAFGLWSGGFGLWSGGFGLWSGGYGNWAEGASAWNGDEPWAGTKYSQSAFVEKYTRGESSAGTTTTTSITNWVDEP